MNSERKSRKFQASPIGGRVKKITLLMAVIGGVTIIGASWKILVDYGNDTRGAILPISIISGAFGLFFVGLWMVRVRGYEIKGDSLIIDRGIYTRSLSLENLKGARVAPNVLTGAIRLFGTGGVFMISGIYKTKTEGVVNAYVTDTSNIVLIEASKKVIISPRNPDQFIAFLTNER